MALHKLSMHLLAAECQQAEAFRAHAGHAYSARMQAMLGVLDSITAQDYSNHRVAPLPQPPPEVADSPIQSMQWRVQRVWAALRMQPLQRLEMLTQFAEWGFGEQMAEAMDAWEGAVAAVTEREGLLMELAAVRVVDSRKLALLRLLWTTRCAGRAAPERCIYANAMLARSSERPSIAATAVLCCLPHELSQFLLADKRRSENGQSEQCQAQGLRAEEQGAADCHGARRGGCQGAQSGRWSRADVGRVTVPARRSSQEGCALRVLHENAAQDRTCVMQRVPFNALRALVRRNMMKTVHATRTLGASTVQDQCGIITTQLLRQNMIMSTSTAMAGLQYCKASTRLQSFNQLVSNFALVRTEQWP